MNQIPAKFLKEPADGLVYLLPQTTNVSVNLSCFQKNVKLKRLFKKNLFDFCF